MTEVPTVLVVVSPEMVTELGKWSSPVQVMIIEATEANRIGGATHEMIASSDLLDDLRKLSERIRPYDDGRCEGDYFADELDELIQKYWAQPVDNPVTTRNELQNDRS